MRITALVMAGGSSRRMGRDKLALPLTGNSTTTILGHVLETAASVANRVFVLAPPTPAWTSKSVDEAASKQAARVAESVEVGGSDAAGRSAGSLEAAINGGPAAVSVIRDSHWHQGPLQALAHSWPLVSMGEEGTSYPGAKPSRIPPQGILVVAGDYPGLQAEVLQRCVDAYGKHCVRHAFAAAEGAGADGVVVARQDTVQPLLGCYRPEVGEVFRRAVCAGEERLMQAVATLRLQTLDAETQGWPLWWTQPVHTPQDYQAWLDYSLRISAQSDRGNPR